MLDSGCEVSGKKDMKRENAKNESDFRVRRKCKENYYHLLARHSEHPFGAVYFEHLAEVFDDFFKRLRSSQIQ